jgi:hypothetical protein
VEVKLGKPTFEDIGWAGEGMAWMERAPGGKESSGEWQDEWVEVTVAVELQPWPDRSWLVYWQDEEMDWSRHFEEPILDGRKLFLEVREDKLEEAWAALKARVAATNRAYRDEYLVFAESDDRESHGAKDEEYARLRETLERRIHALE